MLIIDAGLGLFIGPIAYYFTLESLSVISLTLLFALVLPVITLLDQSEPDRHRPAAARGGHAEGGGTG